MPRRRAGANDSGCPPWATTDVEPRSRPPQTTKTTVKHDETPPIWLCDELPSSSKPEHKVVQCAGAYIPGGATYTGPKPPRARTDRGRNFVTDASDKVSPAVVKIDTARKVKVNLGGLEEFLKFFLGPDVAFRGDKDVEKVRGFGSGVIINSRGKLLTNAHVVANADKVKVTLTDGRCFSATVLGMDEIIDLAVLQLNVDSKSGPLPYAELGDSSNLLVGAWAIAIGNALGMSSSVTLGIISSLHRTAFEVGIPDKRVEYIQTDAAINPGNSGGPLVDEYGTVIGLNTAMRAGAAGIGLAIPINLCKTALPVLELGKSLQHPYLGIHMGTFTTDLANLVFGYGGNKELQDLKKGVLVLKVMERSPAATAGLKRGDVLIEFDGKRLCDTEQLLSMLSRYNVGRAVSVKVRRGKESKVLKVTIGDAKKQIDVALQ